MAGAAQGAMMANGEAGTFGALLRRYREAAALSQEGLAERAGLSAVTISALERGTRRTPHLTTVDVLATALALDATDRAALVAAARPERVAPFSADDPVPLVGRTRELALLDDFLTSSREPLGSAPVLLLAGEQGMGKTRLLQATAQQAVPRGWCVLAGGCQRRGGQEPHAPLLEAMAQHLQTLGPSRARAALEGCAWLVRLLPELAEVLEPLPAVSHPPEQERRLIHAAVARLLSNVAGSAGTLLILDDLQWAGEDALDLINTLVRPASLPLRLVGAYRDTEVRAADPLGLLLADLAQARLARQHTVGPLEETDAGALLQALLDEEIEGDNGRVEKVLHRAGGIPFFLVSYAQATRQGSAEEVPWDVVQGVRQRLALLPEPARLILGAAAVVGRRATRALLLAAAEQPEEAVLLGLDAACGARLLREDGDDAYAFTHDVIREVVEAELGAARRASLHRRVAEALEGGSGGASPGLLAYHYARAGNPDKAVLFLELAGDHAWSQRAHSAAASHYRDALDRLDGLGRSLDAARVREKLGEVLYWVGHFEAMLRVLEPAADTYRVAGDLDGLVRVTAEIGQAHAMRGTAHEGLLVLTALLERVEPDSVSSPALSALYEAQGWMMFAAGQYDAALVACERTATLAQTTGDTATAIKAGTQRINILQLLGRFGEALRVGSGVLSQAEELADPGDAARVCCPLGYIHALQGDFAASRRLFDRAIVASAQMENPSRLSFILAHRAWLAALTGDQKNAHVDLDRALAVSRQADLSWYSSYPLILQARLSVMEGATEAATTAVQEALALTEGSGDLQALRWAAGVMAEIEILEGRAELARERLTPLLDRPGLEECDVTTLLPVLAWVYLELGHTDLAADAVEQALGRARSEGMRLVEVDALRVQVMMALRKEQPAEAARSLAEGLALARAMSYPYAEARLLQLDGLLHLQQGEPGAARERLEAARDIFKGLGARMDTERTQEALTSIR
jgi:transcriptional regulator with XRE-family HTH domain/tetratricopeptide (TPR) repeat protein